MSITSTRERKHSAFEVVVNYVEICIRQLLDFCDHCVRTVYMNSPNSKQKFAQSCSVEL